MHRLCSVIQRQAVWSLFLALFSFLFDAALGLYAFRERPSGLHRAGVISSQILISVRALFL